MKAKLGISTVSTRPKAGIETNASSPAARSPIARIRLTRLATPMPMAIQNGKKAGAGPSSRQPKPIRALS